MKPPSIKVLVGFLLFIWLGAGQLTEHGDLDPKGDGELEKFLEENPQAKVLDLMQLFDIERELEAFVLMGGSLKSVEEGINRGIEEGLEEQAHQRHSEFEEEEAEKYWKNHTPPPEAPSDETDTTTEAPTDGGEIEEILAGLSVHLNISTEDISSENDEDFPVTENLTDEFFQVPENLTLEISSIDISNLSDYSISAQVNSTEEDIPQLDETFQVPENLTENIPSIDTANMSDYLVSGDGNLNVAAIGEDTDSFNVTSDEEPNDEVTSSFEELTYANATYDVESSGRHSMGKRLFRHDSRKGSKSAMKSVLKGVGAGVKKAGKTVMALLKKAMAKMKNMLGKLKEVLKKAVARSKKVFQMCKKGVKGFLFAKEAASTVWQNLPEEIKDMVMDKAVDLALGSPGDITIGLDDLDFDPNSLEDDDELSEDLDHLENDDDYGDAEVEKEEGKIEAVEAKIAALDAEYGEDEDGYDEASEDGDVFSDSEIAVLEHRKDDLAERASHISSKAHHHECCCMKLDDKIVAAHEVADEDLERVDPESLGLTQGLEDLDFDPDEPLDGDQKQEKGLFNIDMDDFDPAALEAEPEEEDPLLDMPDSLSADSEGAFASADTSDYSDESELAEAVAKRSYKKPQCPCSKKGLAKREIAIGRVARKKGLRIMPPMTSAIPAIGARVMLAKAGLDVSRICDGKDLVENCVKLDGVRMGALAGLLSTKILCPECNIRIIDGGEKQHNPFLKGWVFEIDRDDKLDVFVSEAFKSYDGQSELFDPNKNMWSAVNKNPEDEDIWVWGVIIHL